MLGNTEGQNPPISRVGVIAVVGVVAAYRKGAPDPCVPAPHVLMARQRTTLFAAAASVTSAIRPSVDQVRVVSQSGVLGVGVAAGVVRGGEGEGKGV